MFAKVGLKFCQIFYNPSKISQRLLNCCQSSEVSPNLVTLVLGLKRFSPTVELNLSTSANEMAPIRGKEKQRQ